MQETDGASLSDAGDNRTWDSERAGNLCVAVGNRISGWSLGRAILIQTLNCINWEGNLVVFRERGLIMTNLCPEGLISKLQYELGAKWRRQCETLSCYRGVNIYWSEGSQFVPARPSAVLLQSATCSEHFLWRGN